METPTRGYPYEVFFRAGPVMRVPDRQQAVIMPLLIRAGIDAGSRECMSTLKSLILAIIGWQAQGYVLSIDAHHSLSFAGAILRVVAVVEQIVQHIVIDTIIIGITTTIAIPVVEGAGVLTNLNLNRMDQQPPQPGRLDKSTTAASTTAWTSAVVSACALTAKASTAAFQNWSFTVVPPVTPASA